MATKGNWLVVTWNRTRWFLHLTDDLVGETGAIAYVRFARNSPHHDGAIYSMN